MKIAYITAGAAGMYCGSCLHDNTLAAALMAKGHEVALIPTYTPTRTDEEDVSIDRVFYGAVNVFLEQKSPVFRHIPEPLHWILDRPKLLNWISGLSGAIDATKLGDMTLSVAKGETGNQQREVKELVSWLRDDFKPDIVHITYPHHASLTTSCLLLLTKHQPVVENQGIDFGIKININSIYSAHNNRISM